MSDNIRSWARENNYDVGERGPVPNEVRVAYELSLGGVSGNDPDIIELTKRVGPKPGPVLSPKASNKMATTISGPFGNTGPGLYQTGDSGKNNRGASGDSGKEIPPQPANVEIGIPFYFPFTTPYRDAWEVYKDSPVTVTQLESMRRTDGQARSLYRLLTLPILAALKTATVKPVENQDGGEDEATFIEQMFSTPPSAGGMVIPFKRLVAQMLLGLFHGYSAFELVYWVPKKGPLKNKLTLRKAAYRPPETLTFLLNDNGEFDGWRQRSFFQGHMVDVKIPGENSIYYTCNEEEQMFYGVSMFESAFYHFDKKAKLYYVAHVAAQRAAVGTRIGTMPPNPNKVDKDNFVNALSKLGWAQSIIVPTDYTVQTIHEVGNFDYLSYINHHNSQMSKSVLAQFWDEDQGAGPGGSPVVDFTQQDKAPYIMMLQSIMDDLAVVINNQLIPRFIDWNFGTEKYPTWSFGAFTDEQKAAIQQTFNLLAIAGPNSNVSPEFMHELEKKMADEIGLPIDYEEVQKQWDVEDQQDRASQALQFLQTQEAAGTVAPGTAASVGNSAAAGGPPTTTNSGNPSPTPPPPQGGGTGGTHPSGAVKQNKNLASKPQPK